MFLMMYITLILIGLFGVSVSENCKNDYYLDTSLKDSPICTACYTLCEFHPIEAFTIHYRCTKLERCIKWLNGQCLSGHISNFSQELCSACDQTKVCDNVDISKQPCHQLCHTHPQLNPTQGNADNSEKPNGYNVARISGIVVGSVVGVILLVTLVTVTGVLFYKHKGNFRSGLPRVKFKHYGSMSYDTQTVPLPDILPFRINSEDQERGSSFAQCTEDAEIERLDNSFVPIGFNLERLASTDIIFPNSMPRNATSNRFCATIKPPNLHDIVPYMNSSQANYENSESVDLDISETLILVKSFPNLPFSDKSNTLIERSHIAADYTQYTQYIMLKHGKLHGINENNSQQTSGWSHIDSEVEMLTPLPTFAVNHNSLALTMQTSESENATMFIDTEDCVMSYAYDSNCENENKLSSWWNPVTLNQSDSLYDKEAGSSDDDKSEYDFKETHELLQEESKNFENIPQASRPRIKNEREHSLKTVKQIAELPRSSEVIPDVQNVLQKLALNSWVKRMVSNGRHLRVWYDGMHKDTVSELVGQMTGLSPQQYDCIQI